MYQHVKNALNKSGELMIKTSDGEVFELHLHNVKFLDASNLIELDAGHETYWIDGDQVVYFWIHRAKD